MKNKKLRLSISLLLLVRKKIRFLFIFMYLIISGIMTSSCLKNESSNRDSSSMSEEVSQGVSVQDEERQLNIRKLALLRSIPSINDSIFIKTTMGIVESSNQVFINDFDNSRVIALNEDLELIRFIGREGRGPGEITRSTSIHATQDNIYLFNTGSKRFNIYDMEGNFVNDIKNPYGNNVLTHFTVYDDVIYFSNNVSEHSITAIDKNGIVHEFGKLYEHLDESQRLTRNTRHILSYEDKIIAVGHSEPIIEMFSLDGQKVSTCDLRNSKFLKKTVDILNTKREKLPSNTTTTFNIFLKAIIQDNKLLISFVEYEDQDNTNHDYILVIDLQDSSCEPTELIDISPESPEENRYIGPFCTYDNGQKLIAFDYVSGSLLVFDSSGI